MTSREYEDYRIVHAFAKSQRQNLILDKDDIKILQIVLYNHLKKEDNLLFRKILKNLLKELKELEDTAQNEFLDFDKLPQKEQQIYLDSINKSID